MTGASGERQAEVAERTARNAAVVEEFRANGGRLSGPMADWSVVLLHHTGAKSGVERVSPVIYRKVGDDVAVFASNGGRPTLPSWHANLLAHPDAVVEVGTETFPVRARVATGTERSTIWAAQVADMPVFADFERAAPHEIPVVVLERVPAP